MSSVDPTMSAETSVARNRSVRILDVVPVTNCSTAATHSSQPLSTNK